MTHAEVEALEEALGLLRLFRDAGVQMPEGWPHDRDEAITRLENALKGHSLPKFHDEVVMEEIEKRNLAVERSPFNGPVAKWKVSDNDDIQRGFGRTVAEALKNYDTEHLDEKPA